MEWAVLLYDYARKRIAAPALLWYYKSGAEKARLCRLFMSLKS